ncbi:MAG: translation initiation factor IF-2 N-terminal domain-containing protein, partial [Desulfovibrio sp.]|nr:translation initiation factor IF-2 N-terminal domain-containing protein [Desulfovibrio sp.]
MAEIKIKVKDLASELGVPTRDMLPALRELGVSAKSMAGSVDEEEAARLRAHFAARKESTVERTTVQPNVIVRRRRKEAPAPEVPTATPDAETAPEKAPVEAPAPAAPKLSHINISEP